MLIFDAESNTDIENYKLLIGSVIPRPVAFVTTKGESGVINAAPFSYFNIVSSSPPLISLSIQRKAGRMKDTAANILSSKEFVVHIAGRQNIEGINETAANLHRDESELSLTAFTPAASERISVPGIEEAKFRMECVLENHLPLGEADAPSTDLIIGRVLRFIVDESLYHDGRIDPLALDPVARLAGQSYTSLGEIFSLRRPD